MSTLSQKPEAELFATLIRALLKEHDVADLVYILSSLAGSFVITKNGQVCHMDNGVLDMIEYRLSEVIGMPVLDLVVEEERRALGTRIKNDDTRPYNLRLLSKNKNIRYVKVKPLVFSHQGENYRLAELVDHTDITKINGLLLQSDIIIENSPVILFKWKAEPGWPVEFVSNNVSQFGYSAGEFLENTIVYVDLIHPADRLRTIDEVNKYTELGNDNFRQVYRIINADGEIRTVDDRTTILRDGDGNISGYQGLIFDITEQERVARELDRKSKALKAIAVVNQAVVFSSSEEKLVDAVCQSIVGSGSYRLAWIGVAQSDKEQTVKVIGYSGYEKEYIENLKVSWADTSQGNGPSGRAIRENRTILARDIHNDPQFEPWRQNAEILGFQSSITVPLELGSDSTAVLHVYAAEPDAFDTEEVGLFEDMAANIAYGIKATRTKKANLEYGTRLKASLVSLINAMALTVEKRDPYTSGHMNRVAELASAIAKKMDMNSDQIEGLQLASRIHDLGKIYIPAEILNRPGKLSPAEFEMLKSHSEVGYEILKDVDFPWPIAEMVLSHHERLDGSGYPNGLSGDDIILEAQILSVSDVVEAVCSHRPYRPAKTVQEAIKIIQEGKETQFNAEAVDICTALFEHDGFEFSSSF